MYAKARQHNKFNRHGVIFSPSSFSFRDSNVVIGQEIPGDWCAGQIKQIFTFPFAPPSEVYFVVQKFKELSPQEAAQDPYRRYPLVGGRLYHPELEDEIEVVTSQEILAHFAHTPHDKQTFGFPCFHVLPLNKVRFAACGSVAHTVGLAGLSAPSLFVTLPGRLSNRCGLASGSWPWLGRILLRGPVGPAPGFDPFVNVGSAASGMCAIGVAHPSPPSRRPAPQQAAAPEERGTSSPQVQAIDLRGPKEPEEDGVAKEEQEEVNRAPNYPLRENVRLNSLKKVEDVLRVAKLRNEIATKIGVLEVYIKAGDRNGAMKALSSPFESLFASQ
ncbi:hypothetical protein BC826DRAFT_1113528 [Russula brevipes]|nr:hypothetical protein BC826DRAFT_1113528 [Russula brevipes]